ncbi:MAG TPA: heme exporter protein CcmD [Lysobacter sp.]|nr:heme exporter protein CcmD [Lysobacter sp.]
MSYAGYVIAAYAVFFLVLGWDFGSARMQILRQLRAARRRQSRDAARARPKRSVEVQ